MADDKALGLSVLATLRDWVKSLTSKRTEAIPYGECDSTSTTTAFTATVAGITELKDGTTVMLKNGVATSASGFTININNLGAKPVYNNMATGNDVTPTNPTRDTTIFNINYTMLLVYSTEIVSGGGWICYRGYDANTNTIGYQLRTNSGNLPASDTGYRYRLWLTSADGTEWVPINTSTATNATTARTLNTRKIDPFGAIVYNSTNGTTNASARPAVATLWQQYALTVGYSYVLSLTAWKPVYLRCTPQTDGSAVMDVLTQTLPTSKDGKIYIFLGIAYSATAMELQTGHPVYWHDGTALRLWTGAEDSGESVSPSSSAPLMDGTASAGSSAAYARGDHVHPTDTSRQAALVSGTNIKTVNGNSLLGSGDITISGSGGVEVTTTNVLLVAADWDGDKEQTVRVAGLAMGSDVIVSYNDSPIHKANYTAAGIYCNSQVNDILKFRCKTVPTSDIMVNVMIINGANMSLPLYVDSSAEGIAYFTNTTAQETPPQINSANVGDTVYITSTQSYGVSGTVLKVQTFDVSGVATSQTIFNWSLIGDRYYAEWQVAGFISATIKIESSGGGDN